MGGGVRVGVVEGALKSAEKPCPAKPQRQGRSGGRTAMGPGAMGHGGRGRAEQGQRMGPKSPESGWGFKVSQEAMSREAMRVEGMEGWGQGGLERGVGGASGGGGHARALSGDGGPGDGEWDHGPMGPGAMVGAMGGRAEGAERAEQAEGAGMEWGRLKSAEKPCSWGVRRSHMRHVHGSHGGRVGPWANGARRHGGGHGGQLGGEQAEREGRSGRSKRRGRACTWSPAEKPRPANGARSHGSMKGMGRGRGAWVVGVGKWAGMHWGAVELWWGGVGGREPVGQAGGHALGPASGGGGMHWRPLKSAEKPCPRGWRVKP